jgi:hypothetical protein
MKPKKRFKTYFSTAIPPWKEEKLGAGAVTIRFVVTGKIPSKKNNQQSVAVRKDARDYINRIVKKKGSITPQEAHRAISRCYSKVRPNVEYQKFLETVKPVLHEQSAQYVKTLGPRGLTFPLRRAALSLQFYFNNRYITDTVNKQQTIQDMLIDAQIIADDDYGTLNPIHSASACYVDELIHNIAFIQLTFRLEDNLKADANGVVNDHIETVDVV